MGKGHSPRVSGSEVPGPGMLGSRGERELETQERGNAGSCWKGGPGLQYTWPEGLWPPEERTVGGGEAQEGAGSRRRVLQSPGMKAVAGLERASAKS